MEKNAHEAVVVTLKKIGPKVFFAATSSALGFFTLYFSFRITSIKNYGLWTAIGIMLCLLLALFWLPTLLILWLSRNNKPKKLKERDGQGMVARAFLWLAENVLIKILEKKKFRRFVQVSIAVLMLLSILGITKLKAGSAPHKFFPPDSEVRVAVDKFLEKFGGNSSLFIMIDSGEEDGVKDPTFLAKVDSLQQRILQEKNVGDVFSLVDILKKVNQVLIGNGAKEHYSLEGLESNESVAQTILFYDLSGQPEDLNEWTSTDFRYLRLNIWADINDSLDVGKISDYIYKNAKDLGLNIDVGGEFMRWGKPLNYYIVRGKLLNIVSCFPLVFVFSWVALKSRKLAFLAILPLSFTTLVVFGLMGFMGIRLDMATCTIASVVVFLVIDWSFYFIGKLQEQMAQTEDVNVAVSEAIRLETSPVIIDALTNTSAYLVLTFSSFEPIRIFGWLVAIAQVIGSLATLIVIPLAIHWRPRLLKSDMTIKEELIEVET